MDDYKKIEIRHFATSSCDKHYLLYCSGKYYEANQQVIMLLNALQSHQTKSEGIYFFIEQCHGKYSYRYVEEVIKKTIDPLLTTTEASNEKSVFILKREIFSASMIDKFSDNSKFLFKRMFLILILVLTLLLDIPFLLNTDDLLHLNEEIGLYTIVAILLFMLLSSLWHELGHAAACKHFGIKHGGVGFGLYLNIPVLYTDVTDVWRLQRSQRCIVNLAGAYFQAYLLIVVLGLYFYTHYELLKYLALMMNIGFAITLNPFFKFDGYWLMTDLTGVPNLRQRSNEALVYLFRRVFRKPVGEKPYLLQIRKRERWALTAYTAVVNVFMGYYFCYVLPFFLVRFIKQFPQQVRELTFDLSQGYGVDFHLVHQMLSQLLFLILTVYFLYKLILPLCQWKRR